MIATGMATNPTPFQMQQKEERSCSFPENGLVVFSAMVVGTSMAPWDMKEALRLASPFKTQVYITSVVNSLIQPQTQGYTSSRSAAKTSASSGHRHFAISL